MSQNNRCLNVGSCEFKKEGWTTLDKSHAHYASRQSSIDIEHDLMTFNPIPIGDEHLKAAYTSHTIEHISDKYVYHLFSEVYRILEQGGTFRITCPDIGKCYEAYESGDKKYLEGWLLNPVGWKKFNKCGIGENFLFIFAGYLSPYRTHITDAGKYGEEAIKEIFATKSREEALSFFTNQCQSFADDLQPRYPGEHISWWDFDKLKGSLESAGFKDIIKSEFNKSQCTSLENFDEKNADNKKCLNYTLFLECTK